jgi:hypothetical protein
MEVLSSRADSSRTLSSAMDPFEKRGKLNSSSGMAVRPVHMNTDTSFPLMGPKQNPCQEGPEADKAFNPPISHDRQIIMGEREKIFKGSY